MRTCPNCGDPTDGEYLHADCLPEYEAYLAGQAAPAVREEGDR